QPPPPPAGASGALGTSEASGSSQPPPPPPPSSTGTSRGNQRQGSGHLSSSKTVASTPKISNKSATLTPPPTDTLMHDDSTLDTHVHLSDDEATRDDYLPKADIRKDRWKPLPEAERPANLKAQAYEVIKSFYPYAVHLQYQMEECHKMLTDQVDWTNPGGGQVRGDVNRPLPLGGPLGHVKVTGIQVLEIFFSNRVFLEIGSSKDNFAQVVIPVS
nr:hypothetical protein [Tanacetum cinerariifolium]